MVLDVFDLCTPDLQKRLMPMREKIKKAEDAKLERERAKVKKKEKRKKKKRRKVFQTKRFSS